MPFRKMRLALSGPGPGEQLKKDWMSRDIERYQWNF